MSDRREARGRRPGRTPPAQAERRGGPRRGGGPGGTARDRRGGGGGPPRRRPAPALRRGIRAHRARPGRGGGSGPPGTPAGGARPGAGARHRRPGRVREARGRPRPGGPHRRGGRRGLPGGTRNARGRRTLRPAEDRAAAAGGRSVAAAAHPGPADRRAAAVRASASAWRSRSAPPVTTARCAVPARRTWCASSTSWTTAPSGSRTRSGGWRASAPSWRTARTRPRRPASRPAQKEQQLGVLAGTVAAQGPGINLTIDDPRRSVEADKLLDTIQELRAAGAEAIQINDVRVVADTYFADSGGGVRIDGQQVVAAVPLQGHRQAAGPGAGAEHPRRSGADAWKRSRPRCPCARSEKIVVDALRAAKRPDYARSSSQ